MNIKVNSLNTNADLRLLLSKYLKVTVSLMRLYAFRITETIRCLVLGKSADSSLDRKSEFSGDTFMKTSALRGTGNVVSRRGSSMSVYTLH